MEDKTQKKLSNTKKGNVDVISQNGRVSLFNVNDAQFGVLLGCWRLERHYYSGINRLPDLKLVVWFLRRKDFFDFIVDNRTGKLVAYSCTVPVRERTYRKMISGKFCDNYLRPSDISSCNIGDEVYLCIYSIILDHRVRGCTVSAVKQLCKCYTDRIKRYSDRGVVVKGIVADEISEQGIKLAKSFGLSPVIETTHNSVIYAGPARESLLR